MFCLPSWSANDINLSSRVESVIAREGDLNVGILIKELNNGKIIYERHSHRLFVPASVVKLLTAYGALHYLGVDYKFSTTLLTDNSNIKDHVLSGNLYLKFTGDPSLTNQDLSTIFASLEQLAIKQVNGDIIIDSSLYPDHNSAVGGFTWNDQPFCYAAPKTAIVINNNCAEAWVQTSKIGAPVNITNKRDVVLAISNNMNTAEANKKNCLFESKYLEQNQYEVYGCMPKEWDKVRLNFALPDNHKMISDYINSIFLRKHIKLSGRIISGLAKGRVMIYRHQSPPLTELLKVVLQDSNNVASANIFKAMGAQYSGEEATDKNGVAAIYNLLDKEAISRDELAVYDGAGESWYNLISPYVLVSILEHIYQNKTLHAHLQELLPTFNENGTVKNRTFDNPNSQYLVAKTGTLNHTSALAGYYLPPNQPHYAFAIMINNYLTDHYKIKKLEDQLLDMLLK